MSIKSFNELYDILEKSVQLQSFYAELLNGYDGGKRIVFDNAADFIRRLEYIKEQEDAKRTTRS